MPGEFPEKSGRRIDQVVERAAAGATDPQIAESLGISVHTVGTYWKRLRAQYNVPTRAAVVLAHLHHKLQAQERALIAELARRTEAEKRLRDANEELRLLHETTEKGLADRLSAVQKSAVKAEHTERMRAFLDSATQGTRAVVYELESISPVIYRTFSPSAEAMGLDVERLISGEATFYDVIHPEDLQAMQVQMVGVEFLPGRRYTYLFRLMLPEPTWVLDTQRPTFDTDGKLESITGVAMDVSHLVTAGVIEGRFRVTVSEDRTKK